MKRGGIGSHTKPNRGATNDWITPRYIIDAFGGPQTFDLDPCQSMTQPWACARRGYTVEDNGLRQAWHGLCWVNPPYGDEAWPFLETLAEHRQGIGLVFGRTETKMFKDHVWNEADAIFFIVGRLTFFRPDGSKGKGNSGGPSVFLGYGERAIELLRTCGLPGYLVTKWERVGA